MSAYNHLRRWSDVRNGASLFYYGDSDDWYFVTSAAEAGNGYLLYLSNIEAICKRLDGVGEEPYRRENFGGAFGRGEWLFVNPDNAEACGIVENILSDLEDYPIVDEDLFSDMEWNAAHDNATEALRCELGLAPDVAEAAAWFVLAYDGEDGSMTIDDEYWPSKHSQFWGYVDYRRYTRKHDWER